MLHARHLCLTAIASIGILTACAPSGLRPTTDEVWFQAQQRSLLHGPLPSERTQRLLRNRGLKDRLLKEQIEALLQQEVDGEACLALAELCYGEAKWWQPADDARYLTSSMLFAYAYLFEERAEPFDPAFRLACDLYNRSLARIVRWRRGQQLPWDAPFELPHLKGTLQLRPTAVDLPWDMDPDTRFEIAYDFEPYGLESYRSPGLGVPVLAIRPVPTADSAAPDRFRPRETPQAVPLTLVVRLDAALQVALGTTTGVTRVEFFDPTQTVRTEINGRNVPLETDTSTALGYMLERYPPVAPIEGVLNVAAWEDYASLFMLQPYRRGRIPIVFVHGLLSTPTAWSRISNEILADPELRGRYQIWYFRYPTGAPVLYSAAELREQLLAVREAVDPDHTDVALDQMVLVGRSLGGLLTRLQVQDSTDTLWSSVSSVPIAELDLEESERTLLASVFQFKAVPTVTRAVFMVTPHRGAQLADAWFARFFAETVRLPDDLRAGIDQIQAATPEDLPPANAITGLSARSTLLHTLADTPISPRVTYHSIVANQAAAEPGGSDGIVPYESSHLDGAASEVVVQATHMSSTAAPATIDELRRILRLHLNSAASGPATPSRGP